MNIDSINYILSKYYNKLTDIQYLYQEELKEPSVSCNDITVKDRYKIEIELLNELINELEELKDILRKFGDR